MSALVHLHASDPVVSVRTRFAVRRRLSAQRPGLPLRAESSHSGHSPRVLVRQAGRSASGPPPPGNFAGSTRRPGYRRPGEAATILSRGVLTALPLSDIGRHEGVLASLRVQQRMRARPAIAMHMLLAERWAPAVGPASTRTAGTSSLLAAQGRSRSDPRVAKCPRGSERCHEQSVWPDV